MSGAGSLRFPRPVARVAARLLQRGPIDAPIPIGLRRRWLEANSRTLRLPRGARFEREALGGVPATLVTDDGAEPDRAVLYLHGGGYTVGSAVTHRGLAAHLSRTSAAPVHLLDYRLAPEHPYPAALDDALAAHRALLDAGHEPGRIAIAGDSAGAGLALAVCLRLRDTDGPTPGALALISPWADLTLSGASVSYNARRDAGLSARWLRECAAQYRGAHDPRDPGLSPLWAELRGLPPILVQAAADEILVSDADRLVERARDAGVEISYGRFDGLWHDFQLAAGLLADADRAVEELGRGLGERWGGVRPAHEAGRGSANGSAPRTTPTVAIVGGGFAGVGMGIALRRAGIGSFTILERGERVGGVWRDNTYPGATCDVPSHLYSFSFEPNHEWSRTYSPQPEILAYLERCVRRYGLEERLRFGAEAVRAEFDERRARWAIEIEGGETLESDVLVAACGQLSRPAYPSIPGLDRFRGTMFHSARWDHAFDPRGKRVAAIGTGASAIQFVPAIASEAERVYVFQRTAPYVIPKKDRPYKRWEKWMFRRVPGAQALHRLYIWSFLETLIPGFARRSQVKRLGARMFERQFEEQVTDPALREALTPDYEIGCKRLLVSSDWYPALMRPNVELVTEGIREVTATSVVTGDGVKREVDAVILGTGFRSTEFVAPMEIRGLGGRKLSERWAGGAEAYLGIAVSGFPNMFLLYGPNTNLGVGSIIHMLESQISYVAGAARELARNGAAYVDVRDEVEEEFNREIQERLGDSVWNLGGCTSWYLTEAGRNTNNWPGRTLEYRRRTRRPDLADYRVVARS